MERASSRDFLNRERSRFMSANVLKCLIMMTQRCNRFTHTRLPANKLRRCQKSCPLFERQNRHPKALHQGDGEGAGRRAVQARCHLVVNDFCLCALMIYLMPAFFLDQAAAQGIAEMREKLTILGAEIDILKRSITEKERALGDARLKHAASLAKRDGLRQELQELGADFRAKQVKGLSHFR